MTRNVNYSEFILLLIEKAAVGMTVILVEPLRALAFEKTEELKKIADLLKKQSKVKVGIKITTGDYRLISPSFQNPIQHKGTP